MTSINPRAAMRRNTGRRLSGRTALLLGAALAPLALSSVAHAQAAGETVILEEGRTPGPVHLGAGDDRVVVNIDRVNADTGVLNLAGLTTEPLTDAGGSDTVWLRATASQTRDVAFTNVPIRRPERRSTPRSTKRRATIPFSGSKIARGRRSPTIPRNFPPTR
jgi:hypothetical protein